MSRIIDAHHHFWRYNPAEYGWIGKGMEVLRRDFLPADLKAEISAAGIDGVVSVQARQVVEETDALLEFAGKNEFICGVVGWAPLIEPDLRRHLDAWKGNKKLLALRHVLQDEADDGYMLRPDFNRGVAMLKEYGLGYDLLIFERQLAASIELVDRHPNQVFILDHVAKPKIASHEIEPWASRMRDLARRPNVYCKLSAMATEADWHGWTAAQLSPYFQVALETFGPGRLMFGSDWPVCLLATPYQRWINTVRKWIAPLTMDEQARIWGGTAVEAYGIS